MQVFKTLYLMAVPSFYINVIAPMRIHTLLATALLSTMILSSPASAETQHLRFVWASHMSQATDVETIYAASCETGQYQLIVTPARKTVVLHGGQGADLDLSTTTVGLHLLEAEVLAQVRFNCPKDAINIFLRGIKLADLAMPTGFRDSISIGKNGEIKNIHTEDVAINQLATPPNGVSAVPVPQH